MPINEVQILPFSILNLDQFLENGCSVEVQYCNDLIKIIRGLHYRTSIEEQPIENESKTVVKTYYHSAAETP